MFLFDVSSIKLEIMSIVTHHVEGEIAFYVSYYAFVLYAGQGQS